MNEQLIKNLLWPRRNIRSDSSLLNNCIFPKISIITPSFNQGQYLEDTILSVINQNYPNYELIIIDAGSTDTTLAIIKKYESWITYWVSEKDRGQSHAIQKGLAVATGDIINWINSDDLVAPGAFHHIAEEFDLERYDVICGYCDYFIGELTRLDKRNERMGLGATIGETFLEVHINQPSTFFKASVIKRLGIDEQFRYTMDVDLWFRYLLVAGTGRIVFSNNLFTYFRLHDQSKTVSENDQFKGDIHKVFYNIMLALDQPPALLRFMSYDIPQFEKFQPLRYPMQIASASVAQFVRRFAWLAVQHYNEVGDYLAARECLIVACRNGQPLTMTVLRQIIKHFLIPKRLLK